MFLFFLTQMAVEGHHIASVARITSFAEDDDNFFEASSEASDGDLSCDASSRGVGYNVFALRDQRKAPGVVRAGEGVACEIERVDGNFGSLDEVKRDAAFDLRRVRKKSRRAC